MWLAVVLFYFSPSSISLHNVKLNQTKVSKETPNLRIIYSNLELITQTVDHKKSGCWENQQNFIKDTRIGVTSLWAYYRLKMRYIEQKNGKATSHIYYPLLEENPASFRLQRNDSTESVTGSKGSPAKET